MFYKENDFEIIKETDSKAVYQFNSKDAMIQANFFFKKGNVETRGLVYNTNNDIIHIVYPFANHDGYSKVPAPQEILRTIVNRLKEMEIKK